MERALAVDLGSHAGERVYLQGWVHTIRKMGEVNFLIVRDRTGLAQAVMSSADLKPLAGLQSETVIRLEGEVVAAPSAPRGCELHNNTVIVISPVTESLPFPINKKEVTANQSVFLDHAVIGLRGSRQRAALNLSAGIMRGFRETLNQRGFTEIQTPKIVASATESGANVFAIDYFDQTAYLAQSPQFYKQIMVGVFERVYEVGPVFRAEPHETIRHLNEYVSLDVEFGFIDDHFTVMALLTDLLRGILAHLAVAHGEDINLLGARLPIVTDSLPYIHFHDAQQMLTDRFGVTDAIGEPDLSPQHERLLGQWAQNEFGSDYLFVTGYPMIKRPFYTHSDPTRPEYSNSFDLLFRGTELVTGGQRLHLYADYVAAAQARGYELKPFETYFETFKYGMPPHGGFAIGLERFVMQLLGLDNIRMATTFPRTLNRLTP